MTITMLIAEDDEGLRASLEKSFRFEGHEVIGTASASEACRIVRERKLDLVLLDIRLADGSGLDVLAAARALDEEILVIMVTAFPDVKTAVRAMKAGARDFIVKPFELDELHLAVERVLETRGLRREVQRLAHERRSRDDAPDMLGESPAIERVREEVRKVAPAPPPVLIVGETGTGKELVADAVHRLSPRAEGPLVKVNCSAFSEQILESQLFGHERGAFTDAREARAGLFEMADGGTLFLDEVSEMKPELQAKLLRVVEGHPFRRLGGRREVRADVRVLAATNRDLEARVRAGLFREDLYFRLNAFVIRVPPLRERGADIAILARSFLERSAAALRKGPIRLGPAAEEVTLSYGWPGNVRELRNAMERAAILCETGEVAAEHLSADLRARSFLRREAAADGSGAMPSLAEMERRYIAHVLESTGRNISEAARVLGVARNTVRSRLKLGDGEQEGP